MSGHSKWSTIKRKKEVADNARGKVFSKFSQLIAIAVKTGGGVDPQTNPSLREVIERAKAVNMPKTNIKRAIESASKSGENLEEVVYEGFGPEGIFVLVEVATNNRNRTAQEIKGLFDRGGGRLAGPGAVSFNFDTRGLVLLKKEKDHESQVLKLIDLGVEDVEVVEDGVEVFIEPNKLSDLKKKLAKNGFEVKSSEVVKSPKTTQKIKDVKTITRVLGLLDSLENQDDVKKVYANIDVPEELISKINS